jgi:hypothetical protein
LGGEAWSPEHGSLEEILREVEQQRGIPTRTTRRWYYHYLQYGETVPETRLWEKQGFVRRQKHYSGDWNDYHSRALVSLINEKPWLFLDKIQDELLMITGKHWSPTTIWEKLSEQNYSLQVVSYIAQERNEED